MWGKKLSLLLVLVLFVPMSLALTINPTDYNIKDPEFNKEYNVVITVINTKTSTYDVTAHIDRESMYLKEYVNIEPRELTLKPNEKKNIELGLTIPDNITPQEHNLIINFRALSRRVGSFSLDFEVEGEQKQDMKLKDVRVDARDTETPVYFKLTTENQGNIITEVTPVVELHKDGELVDTLGEKSKMQVMPSKVKNLSIMYDPSNIERGGLYSFKAYLKYNNQTTSSVDKTFNLNKVEKEGGKTVLTSKKGKFLELPVNIESSKDGVSFYKIEANIPGTDISAVKEGSLDKQKKEIILKMDTRELDIGEYNLNVKKSKGENLEQVEETGYRLKVEEKRNFWVYLLIPFALAIALLVIFYRNKIEVDRLVPDFSTRKIKKLEKDISSVSKNFEQMEANISSLGNEINRFINEANQWLEQNSRASTRFK